MIPRVLYVITDSGVGGSERVLATLLSKIDRARVEPCGVIVLKTKKETARLWEQTGTPVYELGMGRWPTPRQFSRLRKMIAEFHPDIVHAFLIHSTMLARLARAMGDSFKLISSPRVNYRFLPKIALTADWAAKRYDDMVLCESHSTQLFLTRRLGYEEKKTVVVSNGVDAARFTYNAAGRVQMRHKWGLDKAELIVGSVGRLHTQKGYDVLIESLKMLPPIKTRVACVIVGMGPEESRLRELAKNQRVGVHFVGNETNVPAALSALDIFVQSSRHEGMSNALLEAMSVGCPIVATAVDGTLDLAQDGENMLLVKPENPHLLAAAIGVLCEKPNLRIKLSEKARGTAQKFSIEKMVAGFEDAYISLSSM